MRHGDKQNNLGRTASHRKALLSNLACELIKHKRIVTTLAKAKALRTYVEPLITKSKSNTTHQRRVVFGYLQSKEAIKELFSTVSEKVANRPGGYTRIIKLGIRLGDNAEKAMIELVDFNDVYNTATAGATTATKRTRRGGKKAAQTAVANAAETPTADVAETPAAEATGGETTATETPAAEATGGETTATEAPAEEPKTEE